MGIENYIEEYLRIYGKGNTIEKYRYELMKFNDFLVQNNIEIENIKISNMVEFCNSIKSYEVNTQNGIKIKDYSVSTQNGIKVTVKAFIKYLIDDEILSEEKIKVLNRMKIEKVKYNKQEKYMNKKEIEAFLDFLHNAKKQRNEQVKSFEFLRARDRFLFELLINRGLRATETTLIELSDIKDDTIVLADWTRKNGEELEVYLDSHLQELLRKYLIEREKLNVEHNYLFVRKNGNVMFLYDEVKDIYDGAAPITEELQKRIKQANMWCMLRGVDVNIDEKLTAHCLRHTCSYKKQTEGLTLQEIASLLGQSSLSSTIKYEHINKDDLKEKLNSL